MKKEILIIALMIGLVLLISGCKDNEENINVKTCDEGYTHCMGRFDGCWEALELTDWGRIICEGDGCYPNPEPNPCYKILEECGTMCS